MCKSYVHYHYKFGVRGGSVLIHNQTQCLHTHTYTQHTTHTYSGVSTPGPTREYARVNLLCALVNFAPAGPYTKFAN